MEFVSFDGGLRVERERERAGNQGGWRGEVLAARGGARVVGWRGGLVARGGMVA